MQLVQATSKWAPQESPKERLVLLASKRQIPVSFHEEQTDTGFLARVDVLGQSFLGTVHKQKKLAQQSAAAHALCELQSDERFAAPGVVVNEKPSFESWWSQLRGGEAPAARPAGGAGALGVPPDADEPPRLEPPPGPAPQPY